MRRKLIPVLIAVGALVLAGCGDDNGDNGGGSTTVIKIGSLHPLTGALAADGQQMDNAVKLAVQDINDAGGIDSLDGAKLEVISGDTQGKADIGQSEAQRLIDDGAVALIGPYQSAVAATVSAAAERSEVPFVMDVAVADALLDQGYKYTFRIQPDASTMGEFGAQYLREIADANDTDLKTVAFMHEQTDYGTSVSKAFSAASEENKFTVDPVISYDAFGSTDLTPEVTQVKAANVDVLAVTGYYNDSLLIARNVAAVQPGVDAVFGVANGGYDLPSFPEAAGAAGEGYFDSNYHYDATNPDTEEVLKAFKDEYGEDMRTAAVLSYEAVRVIAAGLDDAGSSDPVELRDAISGLSLDDPLMAFDGPIEFDDTGQNVNAIPIVMQVQSGEVVQVWPEKFATADPRYPAPPGQAP